MNEGDLGKIINLIMENPTLIEEIKALASNGGGGTVKENDANTTPEGLDKPEIQEMSPKPRVSAAKRRELLNALSPYISESRQKAIESFMTIADILELMRGK